MKRRTDYDAIAPSYDRRYAWNHYPGVEAAVRALAVEAARTLEVGCGTGFFVRVAAASGVTAFGVDLSREMLARARVNEGPTAVLERRTVRIERDHAARA